MTPQENAYLIALTIAGNKKKLLRKQPDGTVIIVNSPNFDTRSWKRPSRKARKSNGAQ
jgi:hypothetical protein